MAGEGISRRYEDANSFLLHRKVDVMPHGGVRIRNNPDNDRHHWYHVRSISKNTLKVFDPNECLDLDASSNRAALHSGPKLLASDNFGGQMFETPIATKEDEFTLGGSGPCRSDNRRMPRRIRQSGRMERSAKSIRLIIVLRLPSLVACFSGSSARPAQYNLAQEAAILAVLRQ
jgi:hypothetical protein